MMNLRQRCTFIFVVGLLLAVWLYGSTMAKDPGTHTLALNYEAGLAVSTEHGLTIPLTAIQSGVELMADPVLVIDGMRYQGYVDVQPAGIEGQSLNVEFSYLSPDSDLSKASLVMPAISVPIEATTSHSAKGDEFTGPNGERFRITARTVDEESGIVTVHYAAQDAASPSVSFASLRRGDKIIYAVSVATMHDADFNFIEGSIDFPRDAGDWFETSDAMLEISQFRYVATEEYPIESIGTVPGTTGD